VGPTGGVIERVLTVSGDAAAVLTVLILALTGMKIVKPYEKGLIERLGKYQRTVDSGLTIIIPFLERMSKVDMREQVVDVPPQDVITKDNVVVEVDAVVYYEITDPVKTRYNVTSFYLAATKLAQTNLRNIVGDLDLDGALTSREVINTQLREILDEATDVWGTKVVRVEIQRIDPPPDVTEAMHRQMKAERDRRAIVTEAEGDKRAAILRSFSFSSPPRAMTWYTFKGGASSSTPGGLWKVMVRLLVVIGTQSGEVGATDSGSTA